MTQFQDFNTFFFFLLSRGILWSGCVRKASELKCCGSRICSIKYGSFLLYDYRWQCRSQEQKLAEITFCVQENEEYTHD